MVSPLLSEKTNFGFNVKYNKSGTNPQGKMTIIVRSTDGKIYQVKSSAISAFTVGTAGNPTKFSSKANITDITDPNNPILINPGGQQATLDVQLIDNGEPGSSDKFAITVRTPLGLWFASSVYTSSTNTTAIRTLSGGNLQVRAALTLDGVSQTSEDVAPVTQEQLQPIVEAAKAAWLSTGLSEEQVRALDQVGVQIDSLGDADLGWQSAGVVMIDADAAGHGWFIDATPLDSVEFLAGVVAGSAAMGKVDLLSVVSHEIGHALGFDDLDGESVMSATLELSIRHVPIAPTESVVSNPVIRGITNGLAGAKGVNEKTSIDWDGGKFELATPLGWNSGWTKRDASANFPEFVYAGFDNQEGEQSVFGSQKKRLGENAEEITFEPQGKINWRIEI